MSSSYKTPGVYVQEISTLPPSVAEVETAIPAFIGYTQTAVIDGKDWDFGTYTTVATYKPAKPVKIESMLDFQTYFGEAKKPTIGAAGITVNTTTQNLVSADLDYSYFLYDSVRLFYANGGGPCYIVSVGTFDGVSDASDFKSFHFTAALDLVAQEDEPTILLFPDAVNLGYTTLGDVTSAALLQCNNLMDRVALFDLVAGDELGDGDGTGANGFRFTIGMNYLKYGIAYTPWLKTTMSNVFTYADFSALTFTDSAGGTVTFPNFINPASADTTIVAILANLDAAITAGDAASIATYEDALLNKSAVYSKLVASLENQLGAIPPSGAMAGLYAATDNNRGVWKSPANISISGVSGTTRKFLADELDGLNVDPMAGKSINAIRAIKDMSPAMVMGARTLAGNDNEWRYVAVRRFFNFVETSCRLSTQWAVFEPNDANLWTKVQSMIESFLHRLWREGALAGAKPADAYFVKCGLGKTMDSDDILNGYLNVEVGMAAVRPAEFIVLKFSHKLQES